MRALPLLRAPVRRMLSQSSAASPALPPPPAPSAAAFVRARVEVRGEARGECWLSLEAHERAIFSACVGAASALAAASGAGGAGTAVRVAGGWVRDKLLGGASHDIDIALDGVSGAAFAGALAAGGGGGGDAAAAPPPTVAVIRANPEQSKHLETATMRLHGSWVDFVNLRAEAYEPGSRIPSATPAGSAAQDAERRDFTMNALFYNVSSGAVEDWTGAGLADLAAGTLRTPADPRSTFRDDPLRILRALRFAARFGFAMVPALRAAACEPALHTALAQKVSRERIGNELDAMLGGARPLSAARVLHAFGLWSGILIGRALGAMLTFGVLLVAGGLLVYAQLA